MVLGLVACTCAADGKDRQDLNQNSSTQSAFSGEGIKVISFVIATDEYAVLIASDDVVLAGDCVRLVIKWIDETLPTPLIAPSPWLCCASVPPRTSPPRPMNC